MPDKPIVDIDLGLVTSRHSQLEGTDVRKLNRSPF